MGNAQVHYFINYMRSTRKRGIECNKQVNFVMCSSEEKSSKVFPRTIVCISLVVRVSCLCGMHLVNKFIVHKWGNEKRKIV